MDTLSKAYRHSRSVANLLTESSRPASRSRSPDTHMMISKSAASLNDVESGYSSIEQHNAGDTGDMSAVITNTRVTDDDNNDDITTGTSVLGHIIDNKLKMASHYYSEILCQAVTIQLSEHLSTNLENIINNRGKFGTKDKLNILLEVKDEIHNQLSLLHQEKNVVAAGYYKLKASLHGKPQTLYKLCNYINDMETFLLLSVKVESRLANIANDKITDSSHNFLNSRLQNQKMRLVEIGQWMSRRQRTLEILMKEMTNDETVFQQFHQRSFSLTAQINLGNEILKNIDSVLDALKYIN